MVTFKLPDIGEGIQEGEIVKWYVKEGDHVKKNDIIVEVMTDKVTVQIPSPFEGRVEKIYYKTGEIAKVGTPLVDFSTSESIKETETNKSEYIQQVEAKEVKENLSEKPTMEYGRVLAAPAIRKKARELGIDLSRINGTGENGRITTEDFNKYLSQMSQKKVEVSPAAMTTTSTKPAGKRFEMHGLRRLISEKMTKSKQTIPHFTVAEDVNVTSLVEIRENLKKSNYNISFTPFFVIASVKALKEFPYLNARCLEDGSYEILEYYNIGIAVDTPDGLTVAVVKDADKKSLLQLSNEISDLAERARNNKLKLDEVKDSTFTVTNVGPIGGIFSTPIINYPEVAILGVHRVRDEPNGKFMYITLSADHRLIDGAMAARFIMKVKNYLENPITLLV